MMLSLTCNLMIRRGMAPRNEGLRLHFINNQALGIFSALAASSNKLIKHFDVIFLRNVLIYFDQNTKKAVVERIIKALKPGGYFFISHSESLHRVTFDLEMIKPSIFKKNDRSTL